MSGKKRLLNKHQLNGINKNPMIEKSIQSEFFFHIFFLFNRKCLLHWFQLRPFKRFEKIHFIFYIQKMDLKNLSSLPINLRFLRFAILQKNKKNKNRNETFPIRSQRRQWFLNKFIKFYTQNCTSFITVFYAFGKTHFDSCIEH